MTRYVAIALVLTACSCAQQPIAPDAQSQLTHIRTTLDLAHDVERTHCAVDSKPCDDVRRAGYDAEAAFVTASGNRSTTAIYDARLAAIYYATMAKELPR